MQIHRHWVPASSVLLIDRLMEDGDEVLCLDNYFTGRKANIARWMVSRFELIRHDVVSRSSWSGSTRHLACPASPIHYQFNAATAKTVFGTYNMLGLARRVGTVLSPAPARFTAIPRCNLSRSTTGSANPIGVRSCYDEANVSQKHSVLITSA